MRDGSNDWGYAALEVRLHELGNLGHAQRILSWDEAVMMPAGGGPRRAEAIAALATIAHRQLTSSELGDLIAAAAQQSDLDPWQRANVREIERSRVRALAVPAQLVVQHSLQSTRCEQAWRIARASNDWRGIEGSLAELVQTTRDMAGALASATGLSPYDALIDQFQPGLTQAHIEPVFDELRSWLPGLIERVIAQRPRAQPIVGPFSRSRQESLARELMTKLGFDFGHGRLDTSHHPFCGGDGDDSRITTRYDEDDFLSSMLAVLHETGHALYDQGLPAAWRGLPAGSQAGMAVHESQSLLLEMQVCRSREFLAFAAPIIRAHLASGDDAAPWHEENLYLAGTQVSRGLIRVDADEMTYPLHVILRYELERALIDGSLSVADLPVAWDAKMRQYLGRATRGDDRDGCMQDVHWYSGTFGYFPAYTIGAVMAAQMFAAARQQVPQLSVAIARGDFAPLLGWLRTNVHGRGRLVDVDRLLIDATGAPLRTEAFKAHLQQRYVDG